MEQRRQTGAAALLLALQVLVLSGGCGESAAQDRAGTWEHGVFEWVLVRTAGEDQERYSWVTSKEEVQRDTLPGFLSALGIAPPAQRSAADRIRVVDHLGAAGWIVVNRTDSAWADAGGSRTAERYLMRRRR